MLKAYSTIRAFGFSLIELLVAVAILAILASVAIPSFQEWMLDIQTRNATESVLNGIQKARATAVTLNTNIAFTLTDPAGIDSSWSIDTVGAVSGVQPNIETKSAIGSDGSKKVERTVLPAGATTVTFNSFGNATKNQTVVVAGVPVTPPTLSLIEFTTPGGSQKLRVTIAAGGSARMCDTRLPSTNPRGC